MIKDDVTKLFDDYNNIISDILNDTYNYMNQYEKYIASNIDDADLIKKQIKEKIERGYSV